MGLQITKTTVSYGKEVWQHVHETAQGGFTLDPSGISAGYIEDGYLKPGTPITYNEATRIAKVAGDNDAVKGLLYDSVKVEEGANVAVVLRGTVYERRIPAVSNTIKGKIPLIIFSQSF